MDGTLKDIITPVQSESKINGNRGTLHSPKLKDWNPTIRWVSIISKTLVGVGSLTHLLICKSVYSTASAHWTPIAWQSKHIRKVVKNTLDA